MSFKIVACHGVLQSLLAKLAQGRDPWDSVFTESSWVTPDVVTFADIDRARSVCKMWKNTMDASPEYATMRLARSDYALVADHNWVTQNEYEASRFNYSWSILNTSWTMAVPFSDARFRNLPLASLTTEELRHLRERLSGPGNSPIWVFEGQKISARPDIWEAQSARA